MDANKKITLATFKSFVNKNRANLLIRVKSTFDGMVDGVRSTGDNSFDPALQADRLFSNNLGIAGVWLVFGSRDSFSPINEPGLIGIHVYNCCGSFDVAIRAEQIAA